MLQSYHSEPCAAKEAGCHRNMVVEVEELMKLYGRERESDTAKLRSYTTCG